MRALLIALAAVLAFSALPASAHTVRDMKTCLQAVEDAKKAAASAAITEKSRARANELVQVSENHCSKADFISAENTLALARGIAAQE